MREEGVNDAAGREDREEGLGKPGGILSGRWQNENNWTLQNGLVLDGGSDWFGNETTILEQILMRNQCFGNEI